LNTAGNFALQPDEEQRANGNEIDQQEGVEKRGQRIRQPRVESPRVDEEVGHRFGIALKT
jgi:hypothetical protein